MFRLRRLCRVKRYLRPSAKAPTDETLCLSEKQVEIDDAKRNSWPNHRTSGLHPEIGDRCRKPAESFRTNTLGVHNVLAVCVIRRIINLKDATILSAMKAGSMYREVSIQFHQDDEFTEDRDWIVLSTSDVSGLGPHRALISNNRGFSLEEIQQAACSTEWVVQRDGVVKIDSLTNCTRLAETLERMLEDYFYGSRRPTAELLAIRDEVEAYLSDADQEMSIPLFGYAWLDLSIREHLADAARSADPWSNDSVEIDVKAYRERRITDLLERYQSGERAEHPEQEQKGHKLARSVRSRPTAGETKAG